MLATHCRRRCHAGPQNATLAGALTGGLLGNACGAAAVLWVVVALHAAAAVLVALRLMSIRTVPAEAAQASDRPVASTPIPAPSNEGLYTERGMRTAVHQRTMSIHGARVPNAGWPA